MASLISLGGGTFESYQFLLLKEDRSVPLKMGDGRKHYPFLSEDGSTGPVSVHYFFGIFPKWRFLGVI